MPKIIFTSRYIKGGAAAHRRHLVGYMATRENHVPLSLTRANEPATEKQRQLIAELVQGFPDLQESFEYQDYMASPTFSTASAFISTAFERSPELWTDVEQYMDYVAKRPGAVRSVAGHGLWNASVEPLVLSQVKDELANHKGNIWTHVVSLRREDAERHGYNRPQPWRDLVLAQLPTIAAAMKIPQENLRWYAAYHDREENPHIHLIVYSSNPQQGYLTDVGIEKMRSAFAHDIYQDEMMHLYEQKDVVRSELKESASARLAELSATLPSDNEQIAALLRDLGQRLESTKGRKQYGYLKPELKKLVDEIVRQLAAEPHIAEMYQHWCELNADLRRVYTSHIPEPPPLVEEKIFRSIKNAVIEQALAQQMSDAEPEAVMPELLPEVDGKMLLDGNGTEKSILRAADYFRKAAENKNSHAQYALASLILKGEIDGDQAETMDWMLKSAEAGNEMAQYSLGKYYLDVEHKDTAQALRWLNASATQGNQYAQYQLGKLYLKDEDVERDESLAVEYLTASAEQGNEYAQWFLDHMNQTPEAGALLRHLARMIQQDYQQQKQTYEQAVDRKIMQKINRKKQDLGQRLE